METSFFSGSENLYKYLVTVGLLLTVLTVYYPLKEKQDLEVVTIKVEKDLEVLNYKVKENAKNVTNLQKLITNKGNTDSTNRILVELDKLNNENNLAHIETENRVSEIKSRRNYIKLYKWMFWLFFPVGITLILYGFINWKRAKKYDDNLLKLENEKLELEVKKLKNTP